MALTQIDDRGLKTPIDLLDNEKIRLGTGNDLEIYHDGTDTFMLNTTGVFRISDDSEIRLGKASIDRPYIKCVGDAQVELYYDNSKKFETITDGCTITGRLNVTDTVNPVQINLTDDRKIKLGTGDDLELYHSSNESYIVNNTNQLYVRSNQGIYIQPNSNENGVVALPNGAVELYYDNTKKLETTTNGVNLLGTQQNLEGVVKFDNTTNSGLDMRWEPSTNSLDFVDTVKARFGTGDDLQIYHDGTNSYIDETKNANNLWIRGQANIYMGFGSEKMATFSPNGSVELYYDNTVRSSTATNGFSIKGKSFISREDGGIGDYTNVRVGFYQSIAASGSYTFQVGSLYAIGTVTVWGSRGAGANNATVATGKIYPIHIRAGATAGLGSQIGSDLGGASGGFSYTVAAGSQGITVTNGDSTYAMNTFVTFDVTGFVG